MLVKLWERVCLWVKGRCSFQWVCVHRCMFGALRHLGVDDDTAHSLIRIRIGWFMIDTEIDRAVGLIMKRVEKLSEISPLYEMGNEEEMGQLTLLAYFKLTCLRNGSIMKYSKKELRNLKNKVYLMGRQDIEVIRVFYSLLVVGSC